MVYIQYYQKSAINNELIESCGDRAIIILDGRNNLETFHSDAKKFNGYHRPVYDAYQIFKGDSLLHSSPISKVVNL